MFEDLTKALVRTGARGVASTAGTGAKFALHWKGIPFAAFFLAIYEEFSHHLRKEQLTKEYLPEIAAKLGKPAVFVEIQDMEAVAKANPVIEDALKRSESRRNLAVAVNTIGTAIAAFAAFSFAFPVSAAVAFVSFIAADIMLTAIGKKLFNLAGPSLKEVNINPSLQSGLSLSGQVKYLEGLQNSRQKIFPQQVATLFAKANSPVSSETIAKMTELLNGFQIRAQELAFAVAGDASGVPPLESPRENLLETANRQLQQRLVMTQEQLGAAKEKAGEMMQSTQEKLGEFSSRLKEKLPFDPARIARERAGNKSIISPEAIQESRQSSQDMEAAQGV